MIKREVDPTRDFIVDVDIEEVRRAHDFDSPNAPYQPEVLALARAAERLADEVERLRAEVVRREGST